jgi:hypothetical protein
VAKFTGNQFVKIELAEPVTQIDASLSVWYFYGYSQPYAMFCAIAELITGLLIALPKTTWLGALRYFSFALNIAVINWCFTFPFATRLLISALTMASLILIIAARKIYVNLLINKND